METTDAKIRLGGVEEPLLGVAVTIALTAVRELLALDAERRERNRRQAFGTDVLIAMQAYSEATLFDAAQRSADAPQPIGVAIQIADRQLSLRGKLHFIEMIGTLFDGDAVAIAYHAGQLRLFVLQHAFVLVQFTFCHLCVILSLLVIVFVVAVSPHDYVYTVDTRAAARKFHRGYLVKLDTNARRRRRSARVHSMT